MLTMNYNTRAMNTLFPRYNTRPPRRRCIGGFSLIEVLVVILILSFGMLGVAGLQANTARYKINSWARSSASVQFSDLADRMRANPGQTGLSYQAAGSSTSVSEYTLTADWATQKIANLALSVDCAAAACTPVELAEFDMLTWRANVRRLFPQGAAVVTGNRAVGVTATVAWFDKQFTLTTGALDKSPVCTLATTASGGADEINCCPTALVGGAGEPGVRCTTVSFVL